MKTALRYRATNLENVMTEQGRRGVWLASQLGVSRSFMSHVMKGRRTVDESVAGRVAELLGVPLFLLFTLSGESETSTEKSAA